MSECFQVVRAALSEETIADMGGHTGPSARFRVRADEPG